MGGCASKRDDGRQGPDINLESYAGQWYEFARTTNQCETPRVTDVTVCYKLVEMGSQFEITTVQYVDGQPDVSRGRALPANKYNNVFMVSFTPHIPLIYGRYRILAYLEGEYSLVGSGWCNDHAWILTRRPSLDADTFEWLKGVLENNGYPTDRLQLIPHTIKINQ